MLYAAENVTKERYAVSTVAGLHTSTVSELVNLFSTFAGYNSNAVVACILLTEATIGKCRASG